MDVEDALILTIAIWVVVAAVVVQTIEVYVTLLLIGLLVIVEVAGNFMGPETKQILKPAAFFLIFVFLIIVTKKVLEVLR